MIKEAVMYFDDIVADLEQRKDLRLLKRQAIDKTMALAESLISTLIKQFSPKQPGVYAEFDGDYPPSRTVEVPVYVYNPEPPSRVEIGDKVIYEAWSDTVVQPGAITSVSLGVLVPEEDTGWPGLPGSEKHHFGVAEKFKPEKITISSGFGFSAGYVGLMSMIARVPSDDFVVGAEHLASDAPQPDYPVASEGTSIAVHVRNLSNEPRGCMVRIVGKKVADKGESK